MEQDIRRINDLVAQKGAFVEPLMAEVRKVIVGQRYLLERLLIGVLTQGQLDLQHLQAKASAASVRQQQLRLEAARLESPERVVADARRLGMVPPSFVRYLTPGDKAPPLPPLEPTTAAAPSPKTPPKSAVSAVRPGSAAKNPRLEASPAGAATAVRRPAAPTATSVPKPAATTATTARPTR